MERNVTFVMIKKKIVYLLLNFVCNIQLFTFQKYNETAKCNLVFKLLNPVFVRHHSNSYLDISFFLSFNLLLLARKKTLIFFN